MATQPTSRWEFKSELVDGRYGLEDLVDLIRLRRVLERFTEATGFTLGIMDHPGMNVLVATGWRDICTKFHRACPVSAANCTKSNRHLVGQLDEPRKVVIEECASGLVDCGTPIIIKGRHIASLVTGQLLLEEPDPERFTRQARAFGFDRHAYLEALKEVPVVSEERLRGLTAFLGEMALIISELGYQNLLINQKTVRMEREIAARRQVEEDLRQSEEKYRFLAEKMADIVWTADLDFRTTYVSPSVEKVLGFKPEERTMQSIEEVLTPESFRRVRERYEEEAAREKDPATDPDRAVTMEVEYYRKGGSTVWLEDTVKALRDPEGLLVGLYGVSQDITERKRAEEEKEKLHAQLAQAQKLESLGRLAGGVAHDFNNMLSVILGHTELALRDVSPSEPLHAHLSQIADASRHSAWLIRQLLAFARKQMVSPKLLDLNDELVGMLRMLRRIIGEDIDLVWKPGANLWPVRIDPDQIDQMLANLCVNARDAIAGVGEITIRTGNVEVDPACCATHPGLVPGSYVLLTVRDNGCGMDKEVLDRIFEPFFTTKEVGRGTGLGLATVYGIVKQNEGCIYAASEPGRGTAFEIYLPRCGDRVDRAPTPHAEEAPVGAARTVLVVEDEEPVLELAGAILERLGYVVLSAVRPSEALRLAEERAGGIDLLITDLVMPEMNGKALADRLRGIVPGLKCLFMSGYSADVVDPPTGLDPDTCFVQKPFSMRELSAKVREAMGQVQEAPGNGRESAF